MVHAQQLRESNLALSISGISPRNSSHDLGQTKRLYAIETILEPLALFLSLVLVGVGIEGELPSPYLNLSVLIFALYFPGRSRLQVSTEQMMSDILFNWICIAALLLLLGYVTNTIGRFSTRALIIWSWAAPFCQIGANLALRSVAPFLSKLQTAPQRAIVVGMNAHGRELAHRIGNSPYSQIEILGFFDDRKGKRLESVENFPLLGKLRELPGYVKKNRIQLIYLSLPMTSQPRILHVLNALKDTTASIYFVPDVFVTDLIQGHSGAVCGMPVIAVCETPFTGSSGIAKWASDMLIASFILILISPILLIIAIAVRIDSPGPIVFKQRRYGLDGEEILVYKFRSMSVCEDGGTIVQAQKNDRRITRIGAFLRKTSLDELPQFFNVLQGRMSIVGPRPHAVAHNEQYRSLIKGYMIRHKVKPGITGWAQVNGYRGETDKLEKMQSRIDFDLDYLRNWSLRLDLKIMLKTALVLFKDKAAY